ncbi:MAG: HD domain-containing phosphohydrolase [Casimicrobiaceae bacterium]
MEDDPNDAVLVLRVLKKINGHQINLERVDTEDALKRSIQKQVAWDLVLCDYRISAKLDVLRVMELLEGHGLETPVILLSGKITEEQAAKVLGHKTVHEYIPKDEIATRLGPAIRRGLGPAESYENLLNSLVSAVELRDRETAGHSERVAEMTVRLARRTGMSEPEIVHLRRGALLHDIGKMKVPDGILLKAGSLNENEMYEMRKHPKLGYDFLRADNYFRYSLDIPYCHHERWDGKGYPRGLKGEQIPFKARIFSVVDNYDAMKSDRPYRAAMPTEDVLAYIREQSGKMFDPDIVKVFLDMVRSDSK